MSLGTSSQASIHPINWLIGFPWPGRALKVPRWSLGLLDKLTARRVARSSLSISTRWRVRLPIPGWKTHGDFRMAPGEERKLCGVHCHWVDPPKQTFSSGELIPVVWGMSCNSGGSHIPTGGGIHGSAFTFPIWLLIHMSLLAELLSGVIPNSSHPTGSLGCLHLSIILGTKADSNEAPKLSYYTKMHLLQAGSFTKHTTTIWRVSWEQLQKSDPASQNSCCQKEEAVQLLLKFQKQAGIHFTDSAVFNSSRTLEIHRHCTRRPQGGWWSHPSPVIPSLASGNPKGTLKSFRGSQCSKLGKCSLLREWHIQNKCISWSSLADLFPMFRWTWGKKQMQKRGHYPSRHPTV